MKLKRRCIHFHKRNISPALTQALRLLETFSFVQNGVIFSPLYFTERDVFYSEENEKEMLEK